MKFYQSKRCEIQPWGWSIRRWQHELRDPWQSSRRQGQRRTARGGDFRRSRGEATQREDSDLRPRKDNYQAEKRRNWKNYFYGTPENAHGFKGLIFTRKTKSPAEWGLKMYSFLPEAGKAMAHGKQIPLTTWFSKLLAKQKKN